jgi:hypothetical protein
MISSRAQNASGLAKRVNNYLCSDFKFSTDIFLNETWDVRDATEGEQGALFEDAWWGWEGDRYLVPQARALRFVFTKAM